MVAAVDQNDIDMGVSQRSCGRDPGKAAADNDDALSLSVEASTTTVASSGWTNIVLMFTSFALFVH